MSTNARTSLEELVRECRSATEPIEWASSLLSGAGTAEDVLFFVETLAAAEARVAAGVLAASELPRCSFCLKTSADVRTMISAPGANICNECADIVQATFAGQTRSRSFFGRFWKRD